MSTLETIADLTPDPRNLNVGTERGRALLERSVRELGAGRSIVCDKNGVVIAGNKTLDVAAELGLPIRTVETDGSELVVVQRTDLDLATDVQAKRLALFDNRVSELDLKWDAEQMATLLADVPTITDGVFTDDELAAIAANFEATVQSGQNGLSEHAQVECPECHHKFTPSRGST